MIDLQDLPEGVLTQMFNDFQLSLLADADEAIVRDGDESVSDIAEMLLITFLDALHRVPFDDDVISTTLYLLERVDRATVIGPLRATRTLRASEHGGHLLGAFLWGQASANENATGVIIINVASTRAYVSASGFHPDAILPEFATGHVIEMSVVTPESITTTGYHVAGDAVSMIKTETTTDLRCVDNHISSAPFGGFQERAAKRASNDAGEVTQ